MGGGFTDVLEILPGRFGGEAGARGAGMGVKPVSHFVLVFGGGVFVAKYVGDLAFFAVVWVWDKPVSGLQGTTWNAEGIPEESMLVRDGAEGA